MSEPPILSRFLSFHLKSLLSGPVRNNNAGEGAEGAAGEDDADDDDDADTWEALLDDDTKILDDVRRPLLKPCLAPIAKAPCQLAKALDKVKIKESRRAPGPSHADPSTSAPLFDIEDKRSLLSLTFDKAIWMAALWTGTGHVLEVVEANSGLRKEQIHHGLLSLGAGEYQLLSAADALLAVFKDRRKGIPERPIRFHPMPPSSCVLPCQLRPP